MAQGSRRACFTQKTVAHGLGAACCGRHLDHFEGDTPAQYLIRSKVRHANCTMTEFPARAVCALLDFEIAEG
jgi:hypothetical protein